MNANELSKRYGEAFLAVAGAPAIRRRVAGELRALRALIERDQMLRDCLADPTIPADAKQAILDEIMKPVFDPLTRNCIALLVKNRRTAVLAEIVRFMEARLDEDRGLVKVRVESALPMTEDNKADCRRRLAKWLGKEVALETEAVPELLAGIRIRIGDRLIDGSYRGQLALIRRILTA